MSLREYYDYFLAPKSMAMSHLDLYQKKNNVIFVNLFSDDCHMKIPGIKKTNYFTRDSFTENYGVPFDDILLNYFQIFNSQNNIGMTDDDILMVINYFIKFFCFSQKSF